MAKVEGIVPIIFGWEGNWANDPTDMGGPTMMGVTLGTWKQCGHDEDGDGDIDINDLKLITKKDVVDCILKPHYWDRWKADQIKSQSIANILVDWVWGSGKWGIMIPQRMLKLSDDGIVGSKTLLAVNAANQTVFFDQIKNARLNFIDGIIARQPDQRKFEKGWKNRINSFKFSAV